MKMDISHGIIIFPQTRCTVSLYILSGDILTNLLEQLFYIFIMHRYHQRCSFRIQGPGSFLQSYNSVHLELASGNIIVDKIKIPDDSDKYYPWTIFWEKTTRQNGLKKKATIELSLFPELDKSQECTTWEYAIYWWPASSDRLSSHSYQARVAYVVHSSHFPSWTHYTLSHWAQMLS